MKRQTMFYNTLYQETKIQVRRSTLDIGAPEG
jgi:hypothetical protein